MRESTGREAGFHELVEFIVHKSEVMNSMYGKMEWGNRTTAETKRTSATYKQKPTILSTVKAEDQSRETRTKPKISCVYCKEDHRLPDCKEFQRLSYSEMKFVKDKRLCFLCLEGNHWTNKCPVKGGCTKPDCKNPKHHTLLHDPSRDKSNEVTQEKALKSQPVKACSSLCATNQEDTKNFLPLLATLPVKVVSGKEELCTYALLDSGSQQTFCTERLVDELKLQGPNHVMQLHAMTQTGGANSIKGKLVSFSVSSLEDHQSSFQLSQVMTVDKLPMQKCQVPGWKELNNWEHLEGLPIPELEDKSVDLLIGTDYAPASVPLESRASSQEGPVAAKTPLGWTLYGPMLKSDEMMPINLTSMHMLVTHQESILAPHQYVEEGELKCDNSREDRIALERMKSSITFIDGHFELPLLWRDKKEALPNNHQMAQRRLWSLKRKLLKDERLLQRYCEVMEGYIENGYAELVDQQEAAPDDTPQIWYVPHHGVVNPKKPEKLRIVFDCAAQFQGTSLNDQLMQGPTMTNNLSGVLLRFRKQRIALVADVRCMFHQIKVATQDRDALRFLWWKDGVLENDFQVYRMTVHLFGAASSPSCACFSSR